MYIIGYLKEIKFSNGPAAEWEKMMLLLFA